MGSLDYTATVQGRWRATTFVGLLAILAFVRSVHNGFVYDDERYILKNPLIASWSWDHVRAMLTQPYFGNFHPLHLLAYALERSAFGFRPLGWHAVSVVLHATNAMLLYRLLPRFGVGPSVALVGTAIFAVHPVQAESVAWVAEQKNLLSLLFTLLSLKAYLRARASGRGLPLLAASAAYLAALASKVQAICLLPFLFAIELMQPVVLPPRMGRALLRLLPFTLLGGWWLNLAILAHGRAGFIHPYPGGSLAATFLSDGPVLLAYIKNLLWPTRLAAEYDLPVATEMPVLLLAASWIALGCMAMAISRIVVRDAGGRIGLGLAWVFGCLAPVLNLVPIGPLMNDRYLYAPLCALGPLLAAGLFVMVRGIERGFSVRVPRSFMRTACVVMLSVLLVASWSRSAVWRDEMSLWTDAAAKSPGSHLARYNLGTLWLERGREDLAGPELRAALVADPLRPAPYKNLGVLYYRQRRFRLAAALFRAAIRLEPSSYDLWMSLAAAEAAQGHTHLAVAFFQRASRLQPQEARPYYALGLQLKKIGDKAGAARAFETFVSMRPGRTRERNMAEEHLRNLGVLNRNQKGDQSIGTNIAPAQGGLNSQSVGMPNG